MSSVKCGWSLAAALHFLSLAVSLSLLTLQPCDVSYNVAALSPTVALSSVSSTPSSVFAWSVVLVSRLFQSDDEVLYSDS